jgi:hypothetical protein
MFYSLHKRSEEQVLPPPSMTQAGNEGIIGVPERRQYNKHWAGELHSVLSPRTIQPYTCSTRILIVTAEYTQVLCAIGLETQI